MAINVAFQPSFTAVGALAAAAGAGERQSQLGLAYDQMAHQQQMQRRAQAAQFLQNQQQMAYNASQQAMNRFANQQNAQLDLYRDQQRFQQGMIADRLGFQDRFALQERAAENQMVREEQRQRMMEERQTALKRIDEERQMAMQEQMLKRQQAMEEANFRSRAGQDTYREQMSFEEELYKLPLNDEGNLYRKQLTSELGKIQEHSDDFRAPGLQYALTEWRRKASALYDPKYQERPESINDMVAKNMAEIPGMKNAKIFIDPTTKKPTVIQERNTGGGEMEQREKIFSAAKDILNVQGGTIEDAMEQAEQILTGKSKKNAQEYESIKAQRARWEQQQQGVPQNPEDQLHQVQSAQNYSVDFARQVGKSMAVDLAMDPSSVQDPVEADHQIRNCMADIRAMNAKFGSVENFPPELLPVFETLLESALEMYATHFPEQHQQIASQISQALERARAVSQGQ